MKTTLRRVVHEQTKTTLTRHVVDGLPLAGDTPHLRSAAAAQKAVCQSCMHRLSYAARLLIDMSDVHIHTGLAAVVSALALRQIPAARHRRKTRHVI